MQYQALLIFILYFSCGHSENDSGEASDIGAELVSELRNDANLDLSADEEYEDLRAELLAYHTALASLSSRRSLIGTPCWKVGGICVNYKLCEGAQFITEVPGCKDKHNVCCFRWNALQVRDMRDKGIKSLGLPWSFQQQFGGKGLMALDEKIKSEKDGIVERNKGLKALDEKSKSEEDGIVLRKRDFTATPDTDSAKVPLTFIFAEK